jgi:XTP/dITP diphosphohydrolase
MGSPALTLAASLQRRAARLGLPELALAPELAAAPGMAAAVAAAAAELEQSRSVDAAGSLLWTVVAALRSLDIDAESALRGRSRAFRDRLVSVESDALESGAEPAALGEAEWLQRWTRAGQ